MVWGRGQKYHVFSEFRGIDGGKRSLIRKIFTSGESLTTFLYHATRGQVLIFLKQM